MTTPSDTLVSELLAWFDTWPRGAQASAADWMMDGSLHPYDHLFAPLTVNRLTLANRVIMGPMGNLSMADPSGRPSERMIAYFEARARGGAGLLISGLVPTSPAIDPSVIQPGGFAWFPRIDGSRAVLAGWRDLAEAVHAHGSRFFIQLTPGLGRVGSPECVTQRWKLPVSASWNPNFYLPQVPCRPLLGMEIARILRDTGQAAADAMAAGIDGVQLHGHEGYLLEQFANPAFNRRRFGRHADPERLGLDLVAEIRRRCGPGFPIMYRIDLSLALRAAFGERLESEPGLRRFRAERSVAQTLAYLGRLVAAGVDMIDVDLGCYETWWLPHPPGPMPPGAFLRVARCVKDHFAAHGITAANGAPVPVAAIGKLGYPDIAEAALRDGMCDAVLLARPLLADPDWPRKARAGKVRAIIPCIGDHEGCLNEIVRGGHIQCSVNPRTGFEATYPAEPTRARRPRRIAVVGAGPAGVTAACLAAARGHAVTLFEAEARIGGWLRAGSAPAIKFDVANYLVHLGHRLAEAMREDGLTFRPATAASAESLKAEGFDAILCCTGSKPLLSPLARDAPLPTALAVEVLLDPRRVAGAHRIVVVGGGEVGCETAHMLAFEHGKAVTIVEQADTFMTASCTANRGYLLRTLARQGTRLLPAARITALRPDGIEAMVNTSGIVPEPEAVWRPVLPRNLHNPFARRSVLAESPTFVAAEMVVFATGLTPDGALQRACLEQQAAEEVLGIGDCFRVGRIFDATKAAYAVASAL
ncbi:oxidoreductase [Falsiroseomonas oryzae]|uniref:oxidoreductase n=1 Tax=Falsiroseomonas oryzae TaxID=2766473 RepID=UPI0022EA4CBC|nr:FAD-dependent oxidoreductase [Roseomonas sp. MO-31]